MTTLSAHEPIGDRLIGERLRAERLVAGKHRGELASALGITEAALDSYEAGRTRIEPRQLVAAAQALGISISFFCHDAGGVGAEIVGDDTEQVRWLALSRPLTILSQPGFARVRPLLGIWNRTRGALTGEVARALAAGSVSHRTFLLRRLPRGSRLVVEHCAAGVAFLLPCEALLMVGREFHEMPDRDYGARIIEAYARTAWNEQLQIQSVRALIRTSAGAVLRTRYDRVLVPWRSGGADRFVMCVSLQRERPMVI